MIQSNEVSIWSLDLEADAQTIQDHRDLLSPEERARADRFVFERHQRRFTLGRGNLRRVLGQCLGVPADALIFSEGPGGKPALRGERELRFNLSHSMDRALLAVARGCEVGIDIEALRLLHDRDALAKRFFSPREAAALLALPEAERDGAFFECWTRKEAFIKAVGGGLSLPLREFEVVFGPEVHAALLSVAWDQAATARWTLHALEVGPAFRAAVVFEGRRSVRFRGSVDEFE